mmetsp:Transcript_31451/g.45872  ORF Transcript_31451/g.45872 Transcript_31451/m.45872 type:complete len:154 (-) Transcript_31451:2776-3237(-)
MKQQQKNVRSTQPKVPPDQKLPQETQPEEILDDINEKTNEFYCKIVKASDEGKAFCDLTGRYPVCSFKGNNYIFVMYSYDSNAILTEPIKNRTEKEIMKAFDSIHEYLIQQGLKPKCMRMDNEALAALLRNMENKKLDVQLAPSHMHMRNAAK